MPKVKTSNVTNLKQPASEPRWLYTRRSAAELLDSSVDTIKELEKRGELTPIRLTGPRGLVHYSRDELTALAESGAGKGTPPK